MDYIINLYNIIIIILFKTTIVTTYKYLCLNGGTLVASMDERKCICPLKYTGTRCERPRCIHGLYWSELPPENRRSLPSPGCFCDEGWSGDFCDIPQCLHGELIDSHNVRHNRKHNKCKCSKGYSGERCQDIEHCLHGKPQWDTYKFYSWCACDNGWKGEFCDQILCYNGYQNSSQSCVCDIDTDPPHCIDEEGLQSTSKGNFPWWSFGSTLLYVAVLIGGIFLLCFVCSRLCNLTNDRYEENIDLIRDTSKSIKFDHSGYQTPRDPGIEISQQPDPLSPALL